MGIEEARRILDRVARQFKSTVGFAQLERADPQQLSKFILGEHPQTIALIMAHLHPNNAAELVSLLPEAIRVDVLTRMANLDEISPEVISQISTLIGQRLTTLGRGSREQRQGEPTGRRASSRDDEPYGSYQPEPEDDGTSE